MQLPLHPFTGQGRQIHGAAQGHRLLRHGEAEAGGELRSPQHPQGILWKEYAVCAVGMDVDHTGAEICALEIDDLAAVGDGRCAHLPKAGNYAVFDKQHRLRHEVVVQNKFCVDEG